MLAEIEEIHSEMDPNLKRRIERSGGTVARLLAEEVSQRQAQPRTFGKAAVSGWNDQCNVKSRQCVYGLKLHEPEQLGGNLLLARTRCMFGL